MAAFCTISSVRLYIHILFAYCVHILLECEFQESVNFVLLFSIHTLFMEYYQKHCKDCKYFLN